MSNNDFNEQFKNKYFASNGDGLAKTGFENML